MFSPALPRPPELTTCTRRTDGPSLDNDYLSLFVRADIYWNVETFVLREFSMLRSGSMIRSTAFDRYCPN
ncbi:hypothetical protein L226DRAFT_315348 [Lentinus tigrinus ALCF2SS1-7]|uniref:Uncharacterized protein n=1 Tax=Lentinus tigrinus ALCF2SS1-6 TaxID=1328759 RepID=A0A5C2SDA1_9APHY|nr:hypothetical protein L227DRAFT_158536 [Lentinus tigrinus ALCF2SS1-6]RPD68759.1 hypothetical protein L226DRAFT_315348 [Lentinus tigrinus ALCF2SS1-7]